MLSLDQELLDDMLREARTALEFTDGLSEEDFLRDRKTQYAVVRCLEIIGEAASRVSAEARVALPSIPWSEVIAQRHIAIHHYGKLRMPRIWSTIREHVPALVETLRPHMEGTE
ncbi:MAG TPA: HepT-like ribonuclease domain-containing protein [Thermoanaerobaculia bacterium]|jgi:uncharacterized protein with HEPN domain